MILIVLVIINCKTLLLPVKLYCVSTDIRFSYVGEQFRILCLIYTMHGIGIQ